MIKKMFFTLCGLMFMAHAALAQDVIVTYDAEEIEAKVTEISDTQIKYKKASNPDGPLYTMSISDVVMIRFENGEIEIFKAKQDNVQAQPAVAQTPQTVVLPDNTSISADLVDFHGNRMVANGVLLSEPEIKQMFNNDAVYAQWQTGVKKYGTGKTLMFVGIMTTFVGSGLALGGGLSTSNPLLMSGIVVMCLSDGLLIPGIVLQGVGTKNKADAMRAWRNGMTSENGTSPELYLGFTAQGVGVGLRF